MLTDPMFASVSLHQITRLRRQGERYFIDGLRDISSDRRLAILAVCAVEWRAAIANAVVENHDRIVGKIWRDAKRSCDKRWSQKFGLVVKVDCMMKEVIQNEETKEPFARIRGEGSA